MHRKLLYVVLLLVLTLLSANLIPVRSSENKDLSEYLIKEFKFENVKRHVEVLSSFGSRVIGYPGYYKAVQYVTKELSAHLKVWNQSFYAPSPIEEGASLVVYNGTEKVNIKVHMVYPNYMLVPERVKDIEGELVYVGEGAFENFNGKDVEGKIVVMSARSGNNWINALKLGAKAVIFVNIGRGIDRLEAMNKLCMVPINFPRFMVIDSNSSVLLVKLAIKHYKATLNGSISLKKVKAYNVIAELEGEDPNILVILGAHFDAFSLTPAVAPGADDAIGISFLLELARVLSNTKPKYTVWFVAFSAHWQGLLGPRVFVENYFFNKTINKKPLFTLCFDISSGSCKLVPSIGGFFYAHKNVNVISKHSSLITKLEVILDEFKERYPEDYKAIVSPEYEEGTIFTYEFGFSGFALPYILDAEPMGLAGSIAVTLVTFKDARTTFFTPYDTQDKIVWNNVYPQITFSCFVVGKLLEASINEITPTITYPTRIEIAGYGGFGFATLEVEVVEYDPRVPTLYRPVPYSVVSIYKVRGWWAKFEAFNQYNIFARIIALADENGKATIYGIPVSAAAAGDIYIEAFKFDSKTGELIYGPDEGPNGAGRFPHKVEVKYPIMKVKTVVFKCSRMVLTDLILPDKPHALITLNLKYSPIVPMPVIEYESPMSIEIQILRALSFVEPESYGGLYDPLSSIAVAFIPPKERVQLIVAMTGLKRKTILLLNSTADFPDGFGYMAQRAGQQIIIPFIIEDYVKALYYLSTSRYKLASTYGVVDPVLERYLKICESELNEALKLRDKKLYADAYAVFLKAWSISLKAYERSKAINMDAANSTIPLLILMIPFALLIESLIFSLKGYRKVALIIVIALITFIIIRSIHPGFQIAISLSALVIGVVLIVMLAPTIFFLVTELSYSVAEIRKRVFGRHFLERERVGLIISAIDVGIQNMRKRPLRSILTSIAVILLVALLISLTSLLPLVIIRPVTFSLKSPLTGIMVRAPHYEPLSENFVCQVKRLLPEWEISERYWAYLKRELVIGPNGTSVELKAILGLSPHEKDIAFKNVVISDGGWFGEHDVYACILPAELAKALGVGVGDEVRILGLKLTVIGICEQSSLESTIDLDDNLPVPLDVEALETSRVFDERMRLTWSEVIIVSSRLAKIMPGFFISSIGIVKEGADEEEITKVAKDLFEHFDNLAIYACYEGRGTLFSKAYSYTAFGMEFMIVPIVLVSLILITTLLGGIHERLREASIYSALGLTPTLVAMMFLTEGIIYAILGEILGYITGALIASSLRYQEAIAQMIGINYSSSSIAMTIGVTLAVIIGSSSYPFIKIASLVTPSLERRWKPKTKPKGDLWEISLPYVFTSEREVIGLLDYLKEFMEAKKIERAGTFSVIDVSISVDEESYSINATVRLAPFELNIVQNVLISFLKSKTERRIYSLMRIKRSSGPYSSWLTSNLRFIDDIRKQLLTWRLLKPSEQEEYISRGMEFLKGTGYE